MIPVPDHLILPLSCRKIPLLLRYSSRASSIRLRILNDDRAELVLPAWCRDPGEALLFAKSKASWVEKILSSRRQRAPVREEKEETVPEFLKVDFTGKTYPVLQEPSDAVWTGLRLSEDDTLILSGNMDGWNFAFREWVKLFSRRQLIPFAQKTAMELNAFPPVREYRTKLMQSRWGSCSSKKIVTLNASLIFFRPEVVRSVVVHELCHLHEMNHSPRFWKLVFSFQENYPVLKKELTERSALLPEWITNAQ